jgi:ribosomal protein S6
MTNFQIGQEVDFSNAMGVNVITEIKGNTATTSEPNTGFTYKKRLTSLKAYVEPRAYWGEQELTNPIHKHGDIVFTTLSCDANGSRMVWDDVKKDCVTVENLTR